jgi:hypothetical protein
VFDVGGFHYIECIRLPVYDDFITIIRLLLHSQKHNNSILHRVSFKRINFTTKSKNVVTKAFSLIFNRKK